MLRFEHDRGLLSCPHVCGGEPNNGTYSFRYADVVPTCVGVNRSATSSRSIWSRCPHVCGGEPLGDVGPGWQDDVVPTCVGVNRKATAAGGV